MTYYRVKAYGAEAEVFSGRFAKLREVPDGMTVADQRAVAAIIIGTFNFHPMPTVVRKRGRVSIGSWAYPSRNIIAMGALAGPALVCHEVAHLLAPRGEHHGVLWEVLYVECVGIALGSYHAKRLHAAFAKARG